MFAISRRPGSTHYFKIAVRSVGSFSVFHLHFFFSPFLSLIYLSVAICRRYVVECWWLQYMLLSAWLHYFRFFFIFFFHYYYYFIFSFRLCSVLNVLSCLTACSDTNIRIQFYFFAFQFIIINLLRQKLFGSVWFSIDRKQKKKNKTWNEESTFTRIHKYKSNPPMPAAEIHCDQRQSLLVEDFILYFIFHAFAQVALLLYRRIGSHL